jgi:hypothetical protein
MRLQWKIWTIEAKLFSLVLAEALIPTVFVSLVIAEFMGIGTYTFKGSLATFFQLVGAGAAIAFCVILYRNLWSEMEGQSDEPLREKLAAWPELESMVLDLARDLKRPAPAAVAFLLSPMTWRRFGCDTGRLRDRGEIVIPASCLEVWSIASLRCQIGHALVRRRPKPWLFFAVRRSLNRLVLAKRPRTSIRHIRIKLAPYLQRYLKLLSAWHGLADVEADARIARLLGGSAVSTWICQSQLAGQVAVPCLQRIIQPAAERGMLLPIATAFGVFYGLIEPGWLEVVEVHRVKAQRSQRPSPLLMPLLMRLAVLADSPGRLYDPRPAARLLPALDLLEERLWRHEAGAGRQILRRADMAALGEVLLPAMREEVDRNADALQGRSIADLPDLVQQLPALAEVYHPDPRFLFGTMQRKACVPGLLAAFLAVELERNGWRVRYAFPPGLTLERDGRTVCPRGVVEALRKGEMTREAYLQLVDMGAA